MRYTICRLYFEGLSKDIGIPFCFSFDQIQHFKIIPGLFISSPILCHSDSVISESMKEYMDPINMLYPLQGGSAFLCPTPAASFLMP